MFGLGDIWGKLPESIFEDFESFKIFKNGEGDLSPKPPESLSKTCDY